MTGEMAEGIVESGSLSELYVAYAPDAGTADRALVAKAAFFAELGVVVHLCGEVSVQ